MSKKTTISIISLLFIFLFLYTAVSKLLDYGQFSSELSKSPLFTPATAHLAWTIPIVELLLVVMLTMARWRLKALYASFVLMILFTIYIFWLANFTYYVPCSCGGILEQLSPTIHIILNIFLSILALAGIWLQKQTN